MPKIKVKLTSKMDFDWTILSFPHVAQLIFEHLDPESLRKCTKVCKSWCEFLEKSKFYWLMITKDQPGWKKLQTSVDFDTFVALSNAFIAIDEMRGCFSGQKIHPLFCSIQMNDLELLKTLSLLYEDDHEILETRVHFSWTPLEFAARIGRYQIVKYIYDNTKEDRRRNIHMYRLLGNALEGKIIEFLR